MLDLCYRHAQIQLVYQENPIMSQPIYILGGAQTDFRTQLGEGRFADLRHVRRGIDEAA